MSRRGEPRSKLTWAMADEIRAAAGTVSTRELARRYGVVPRTISQIIRKETWVWVERVGYYDAQKRKWMGPPSPCLGCSKTVRAFRCFNCQKGFLKERAKARRAAHVCNQCGGPNEDWQQRVNCCSCRAAKHIYDIRRNAAGKASHRVLKLEVLSAYGGLRCACCGEEHVEFLTLDHVNGGGNEHRLALTGSRTGGKLYRRLKELGFPNDPPLQVLCLNCNWAKGHFDSCPHQREAVDATALLV